MIGVMTVKNETVRAQLGAFSVTLLLGTFLGESVSVANSSAHVVDIRNIGQRDWEMASFSLDRELVLDVEAHGAETEGQDFLSAYAWILNAQSRDVVWEMNLRGTSPRKREKEMTYKGTITLPEGGYEVYFAISTLVLDIQIKGMGDLIKSVLHDFQSMRYSKDWGMTIDVKNESDMKYVHEYDPRQRDRNVIVHMTQVGDHEFRKEGLTLKRPLPVRIYAVGEGSSSDGEMYDYGWITDTRTRKRVWEMTSRNTDHAGGADKNLLHDGQITLPAGSYFVHYVTDGSHSYEKWNARPPYDPPHWGITLLAVDSDFTSQDVAPYAEAGDRRPLVEITRVRDDELQSRGFTLLKSADLHIYALGEYAGGQFCDYGMILDAHTRETVWSMTHSNTHHAGGGEKNRLHDDIVHFPQGDYIVYYISDDSHSYQAWNAGPPYDPDAWGITLWVVEEDLEPKYIREYSASDDPHILINLTALGDQEKRMERFYLDKTTRIRIYAIGEGDRDHMYDYGWIEDDRHRIVWEMTFGNTEHAGGAKKNRVFNDIVVLRKGEYTVQFVTDASHSFERWNAHPPNDPFSWGIMAIWEE